MILVRDIFQIKFGKMRDAMAIWKDAQAILKQTGHHPDRMLTDMTGEYYTLVMESTFKNLEEFEKGHASTSMSDEFRNIYKRFTEYVTSGRREIFTVVQ
jgi:hypothetical protein